MSTFTFLVILAVSPAIVLARASAIIWTEIVTQIPAAYRELWAERPWRCDR